MKITLKYLEEHEACPEGLEYFKNNYNEIEHEELIKDLLSKDKFGWADWLVSKLLSKENKIICNSYVNKMLKNIINYCLEFIKKQEKEKC